MVEMYTKNKALHSLMSLELKRLMKSLLISNAWEFNKTELITIEITRQ